MNMIGSRLYIAVWSLHLLAVFAVAGTPVVEPVFLDSLAHDQRHFTQGLFFDGENLVETTGQYGRSALYRYDGAMKVLDSYFYR